VPHLRSLLAGALLFGSTIAASAQELTHWTPEAAFTPGATHEMGGWDLTF
jgi:hypothetical protein